MYLQNYQDHNWNLMDFEIENKYGFPIVKKQQFQEIEKLIPYNNQYERNGWCHFFLYDYMFRALWNQPNRYLQKLESFKGILAPDFSTYTDYPLALNIFNVYRNRWLGKFYQSKGIKVIPTIVWGDYNSFEFCFEGIEKGCQVAVTSMGTRKNPYFRKLFSDGINELKKVIEPNQILLYGKMPEELINDNLVKHFSPYYDVYEDEE